MEVCALDETELEAFYALRVEALQTEPSAFWGPPELMRQQKPEDYLERVRAQPQGNFVLGAFVEDRLLGSIGLNCPQTPKLRHKAEVREMYVTPRARGKGIATALLRTLIERALTYPDLAQLHLMVSVSQTSARALYLKFGFEPRAPTPVQ